LGVLFLTLHVGPELFGIVLHVSRYGVDSHKATGPDGIPARLLHEYASYIAPALTKIFQISVTQALYQMSGDRLQL
jgi:hypothetical protein